jgi:N,N-dimethylformamidase beta subunit-like protein
VNLVGYSDVWSVAPGDRIRFMVSTTHRRYQASIVRLFHGDPKPGGPGRKIRPVETGVDGEYNGREQRYPLGSYGIVDPAPMLEVHDGLAISAWIFPTTPGAGAQGIVTCWDEREQRGFGLFLEDDGDLGLRLDGETIRTGAPLRAFAWARVRAEVAGGRVRLEQSPLLRFPFDESAVVVEHDPPPEPHAVGAAPLVLGGHLGADGPVGRFNGKLESPRLESGGVVVAEWDFSRDIGGDVARDVSGHGHDGRFVNMPMHAVTGHAWTGREVDWKRAPDQYGAVFLHDDDLEDARWEPDFELVVPDDLPTGVYAAWLRAGGDEEWLPFFVRPPRGTARAAIAFLAPTLSYLAYANEHAAITNPVATTEFDLWDYMQPEDHLTMDVPLLGLYDKHRDGVGCCYSSRLRPVVNMRPHYHLPLVRSAHQFPADLHLVDWLDEKGFEVDVVTDEDLHAEGLELLARYRVVVTGSHPEYWTTPMLDALRAYLESGGRVMYLGGNGFYWVTSIDPARPHVIEVRRGRRGTGTWRGAPGEDYHSTTGEPGGLWRDRGRPPQRLVGVGMATQGFDRALPFEREEASGDPRASWIFDGVAEGPIGDGGLVMGGAAGLEVDRLDHALGTPPHALLLASATGFSDSYQHVVEEVESSDSKQGGSASPFVRGDMVFYELPDGGAVFSASSISWCGCLSENGYDNAVSRITENVLRRFAAAAPVNEATAAEVVTGP